MKALLDGIHNPPPRIVADVMRRSENVGLSPMCSVTTAVADLTRQ